MANRKGIRFDHAEKLRTSGLKNDADTASISSLMPNNSWGRVGLGGGRASYRLRTSDPSPDIGWLMMRISDPATHALIGLPLTKLGFFHSRAASRNRVSPTRRGAVDTGAELTT